MDWWQQKGLSTGIRRKGRSPKQMIQKLLSHSGSSVGGSNGRTRRAWSEWGRKAGKLKEGPPSVSVVTASVAPPRFHSLSRSSIRPVRLNGREREVFFLTRTRSTGSTAADRIHC